MSATSLGSHHVGMTQKDCPRSFNGFRIAKTCWLKHHMSKGFDGFCLVVFSCIIGPFDPICGGCFFPFSSGLGGGGKTLKASRGDWQ